MSGGARGGAKGPGGGQGGAWETAADATPPLLVCCQESGHLLCKLSDDNHHLMAPERQRGPCVQRLWPLLQAAQCECTPPLPRDLSSLCCLASQRPQPQSPAWLGLGSRSQQPAWSAQSARRRPVRRRPLLWRWDRRGQGRQGTGTSMLGEVGGRRRLGMLGEAGSAGIWWSGNNRVGCYTIHSSFKR